MYTFNTIHPVYTVICIHLIQYTLFSVYNVMCYTINTTHPVFTVICKHLIQFTLYTIKYVIHLIQHTLYTIDR